MGSTLDRNDNQGIGAFWALVHGRDHSSGPGIGANVEMLFQTQTRLLSKGRYVDSSLLNPKCIPEVDKGQQEECEKASQNQVIIRQNSVL